MDIAWVEDEWYLRQATDVRNFPVSKWSCIMLRIFLDACHVLIIMDFTRLSCIVGGVSFRLCPIAGLASYRGCADPAGSPGTDFTGALPVFTG